VNPGAAELRREPQPRAVALPHPKNAADGKNGAKPAARMAS
jgi:hypothetical protein